MSYWRSPSEPPKNSTTLLICNTEEGWIDIGWLKEDGSGYNSVSGFTNPTHWRPLPSMPKPYSIAEQVRIAVESMKGDFTLRDTIAAMKRNLKCGALIVPARVSNSLKRLLGTKIKLVQKGTGRRGNKYRRIDSVVSKAGAA